MTTKFPFAPAAIAAFTDRGGSSPTRPNRGALQPREHVSPGARGPQVSAWPRLWLGLLLVVHLVAPRLNAADLPQLWRERVQAVVAVEFYIESEIERRPTVTGGLVVDDRGTIILQGAVIPPYLPPGQLKDFRVYRPGAPTSDFAPAEYLGPDAVTNWHFIRVDPALHASLVPITRFVAPAAPSVSVAEEVWGIGMRGKDEDFEPYFLSSRVALLTQLPQHTAIALGNVTAPQLPVFDRDGVFLGIGQSGFGETYYQYSRTERGTPLLLVSGDESRVFRLASDVVPHLGRIPSSIVGRPAPWLGVMGLQPVPPDVARFLKLDNQGALVVSEVLEGGPADAAGVKERDIIVAVEGKPLPRLKPPHVVAGWIEREMALRKPGDTFALTVLRGNERIDLKPELREEPRMLREAERRYFDRLGFTTREFLTIDGVAHRIQESERAGVVVHFVKNNSPAATAGLRAEDWVREIDGVEVKTYTEAIAKLDEIEKDQSRREFILLVSRGGETSVLRVKLR